MPTILIQGLEFSVPAPYVAGAHELTEGEAKTLNQTLAENVRNNFAKRVTAEKETAEREGREPAINALQADLDAYTDAYEFGVRQGGGGGGGRTADPVGVEAMELARADVRAALVKAGKKLKDYKAAVISDAAKKLVDSKPRYRELAAERVAQMQEAAEASMADVMAVVDSVPAAA
jgi:hypothetical protein